MTTPGASASEGPTPKTPTPGTPTPGTMRALVVAGPGRLEIQDVPVPSPGRDQVMARVRAVSICGTDVHLIHGDYPGFWPPSFPFIPGHEWAGELVALGPGAERYGWKVGDRVAGTSHDACGVCRMCVEGRYNLCESYGKPGLHRQYGHNVQGSDATYVVHGVKAVFPLPDELSFDEGALVDPASIALHVANRGGNRPGDTVAIIGAGSIGLLSADAARIRGAGRVIVVGRGWRLSRAAELGFEIVDSEAGDPAAEIRERTGGLGVDVVLECAGVPETIRWGLDMLRRGGRCARGGHPDHRRRAWPAAPGARRARAGRVACVGGRDAPRDAAHRRGPDARSRADHAHLRPRRLPGGDRDLRRPGAARDQDHRPPVTPVSGHGAVGDRRRAHSEEDLP